MSGDSKVIPIVTGLDPRRRTPAREAVPGTVCCEVVGISPAENKQMFVCAMQAALVAGDPQRYGHLSASPIAYVSDAGGEFLVDVHGASRNVSGDSLTAIARELSEMVG